MKRSKLGLAALLVTLSLVASGCGPDKTSSPSSSTTPSVSSTAPSVSSTAPIDSSSTSNSSILNSTSNEPVEVILTVEETLKLSKDTEVIVEAVVIAMHTKGYLIDDTTGKMFVWLNTTPTVEVGDYVKVSGILAERYDNVQIDATKGSFTEELITDRTLTIPEETPVEITEAEWDAFNGKIGMFVEFRAQIVFSGNFINLVYGSATREGAISYSAFTFEDKTTYDFTAYLLDKTTTPRNNILVVSAEKYVAPINTLTLVGDNEVEIGSAIQLSVEETKDVTWTSLNPSRATVTNNGIVTGLSLGKVDIKVEAGDKSAVKTITVINETTAKVNARDYFYNFESWNGTRGAYIITTVDFNDISWRPYVPETGTTNQGILVSQYDKGAIVDAGDKLDYDAARNGTTIARLRSGSYIELVNYYKQINTLQFDAKQYSSGASHRTAQVKVSYQVAGSDTWEVATLDKNIINADNDAGIHWGHITASINKTAVKVKIESVGGSINIDNIEFTANKANLFAATEVGVGVENTKYGAPVAETSVDGLIGKVVQYNGDGGVCGVTIADKGFVANLTAAGANFYSSQIFYHNSKIVTGSSYEISMTITATVDSIVRINAQDVVLVADTPYKFTVTTTSTLDGTLVQAIISIQFGKVDGNLKSAVGTYTFSNVAIVAK